MHHAKGIVWKAVSPEIAALFDDPDRESIVHVHARRVARARGGAHRPHRNVPLRDDPRLSVRSQSPSRVRQKFRQHGEIRLRAEMHGRVAEGHRPYEATSGWSREAKASVEVVMRRGVSGIDSEG